MTLASADVSSYDDYLAMQELTQRVWPVDRRWHVGEVAWSRWSAADTDVAGWRTALWTDHDRPVAWGWLEPPGFLSLVTDPAHPEVCRLVLDWFDDVAAPGEHACVVLESQLDLVAALTARGFVAQPALPYFTYHVMQLDQPMEPMVPDGFTLRPVSAGEAEERAGVHRAGWSDFGSTMSAKRMGRVMRAWPYRPELDWVAIAPDGRWAATALGWLDERNASAILEPVSCVPDVRRRGLARAVSLACLQAMRAAGASTALVNPRGDAAYPVPGALYRGIGFQPRHRTVTYVRPLGGRRHG